MPMKKGFQTPDGQVAMEIRVSTRLAALFVGATSIPQMTDSVTSRLIIRISMKDLGV